MQKYLVIKMKTVVEDKKCKLVNAVLALVKAMKSETEECGKLCGGVNEKELTIINYIANNENVKMTDLAENIEAPMSTITSIVDKLVKNNFLVREHSGNDRRVINVSLTPTGKSTYNIFYAKRSLEAEKLLAKFNESEQDIFINHINLLASSMSS